MPNSSLPALGRSITNLSLSAYRKRILLADDDEDDRILFKEALSTICNHIDLAEARDGQELMSLLADRNQPLPALIFLDINMPGMNGKECLLAIRAMPVLAEIPVVMLSTSAQAGVVDEMFQAGATRFICKPRSFEGLIAAIGTMLNDTPVHSRETSAMKDFFLQFP